MPDLWAFGGDYAYQGCSLPLELWQHYSGFPTLAIQILACLHATAKRGLSLAVLPKLDKIK